MNILQKKKHGTFEALVAIRIIVAFVPVVNYLVPNIVTFLTFILLYGIVLSNRNGLSHAADLAPIFLFDMMNLVFLAYYGFDYVLWEQIYAITRPLLWATIAWFIMSYGDVKLAKHILLVILVCYVLTGITTIAGCFVFPNAARLMANGMSEEQEMLAQFQIYNIGGFSFVYSVTLLIPLLIHFYKDGHCSRWLLALFLGLIFSLVIVTEYTIALIGALFATIPLFFKRNVETRKILITILLGAGLLFSFKPFFADLINWFSTLFDSEQIATRLQEISMALSDNLTNDDTDLEDRMSRWETSWKLFVNNFFIGSPEPNGGHSFIFDNMAKYGIVGIIAMMIVGNSIYKHYYASFKNSNVYTYLVIIGITQLIYAFLNPKLYIEVFVLIVPLYTYIYCRNENSLDNKHTIA